MRSYARAILCVSVAAEARPESPYPRYERAALEALSGQPERALDDLEAAVSRGYGDGEELGRDEDFAALRGSARFPGARRPLEGVPSPPLPAS